MATTITTKGFIKDWAGNKILPITRGELVLDKDGQIAFNSEHFLANANGNGLPGLITAAERAMLTGSGTGGGIADIYNKLGHINTGLKVNNTVVKFYNDQGTATPINITSTTDASKLSVGVANNVITLALSTITVTKTNDTKRLKSITVDSYGRVTALTGADITNAEIPAELTGKTITSSTIKSGVTDVKEIADNELAIVNKAYVDAKFANANNIATGALKFGGPLSDAITANTALVTKASWNSYFKITGEFNISTSDLYDTSGVTGSPTTIKVKVGDTLIVYASNYATDTRAKFVHVPSGDDITTISVTKDNVATPPVDSKFGNVVLKFSEPFTITNPSGGNTAYIALPDVSLSTSTNGGYLSKADYNTFKNYANNLKVDYTGEFSSGTGVYKIGTLTIGTGTKEIYGKYNISGFSLENGASDAYNPILKFTETGATDVKITVKGLTGIKTKKNGDAIEITAANEVKSGSASYLEIDKGYQFGVKIGSVSNNTITNGLTDYNEFATFRSNVILTTTVYEKIDNKLSDTTKTYYYGSTDLVTAITVEI